MNLAKRTLALLLAAAPPAAAAPPTRTVAGLDGQALTVPARPARIADLWFAHNELLVMLGATDRIAATVETPALSPWMFRVAPGLRHATALASPTPDAETLLAAGVDLAFTAPSLTAADALRRVGIPTVPVAFTDAASMIRCIDLTADVLGTPAAHAVAARYEAELAATIHDIRAVTDPLPPEARPRVLHVKSLSPLLVDGDRTLIDDWIRIAGGRNAAAGISGNMKPVSVEQVVAWNPEIIVLGGTAGSIDTADPLWRTIRAVRDGRILRNPAGMFAWDRYGTEYLLQLRWAASVLHPGLFSGTDIVALTQRFYRDYFGYPLSPPEARRIVAALPPA